MINKYRYILFPFSILYAIITGLRNGLYDKHILKQEKFDVPVINVGNLSMGGTGKTPMIEYLIRLLKNNYRIAVVSRGYKRKTNGFILADKKSTPEQIGDEPYQIYKKFPQINVAVGENRVEAVRKVLAKINPDVILLDDAFQHRRLKAGLNILLTSYQKPFFRDFILPAGNLRESKKGAERADIVVVTKSPERIEEAEKELIVRAVKKYTATPIFFAGIKYGASVVNEQKQILLSDLSDYAVLLVTGIANPKPLYWFLSEKNINFESLKFGDHHHFSQADVQQINKAFERLKAQHKIILTTEKDFVRLHRHFDDELYYLPIETQVFEKELFNNKILAYVSNKRRI